jgi:hypothetical protein
MCLEGELVWRVGEAVLTCGKVFAYRHTEKSATLFVEDIR